MYKKTINSAQIVFTLQQCFPTLFLEAHQHYTFSNFF